MVKNLFKYIFIYVMLIGCEGENPLTSECESGCYLNIEASNLVIDKNGYHHMEWLSGYNQTFATIKANTGSNYITKVYWDTDLGMWWHGEVVKPINHASYTDEGIATTILGPWDIMIDDTITVYSTYEDNCGYEYLDSIKVIVDNLEDE
jgi:hypothetical protein